MYRTLLSFFDLGAHGTSWKKELLAGFTAFFTSAYILLVNPMILKDAGIPLSAGIMATIAASVVGCLLMALWANAPMVVIPGMGINALFSYTLVQSLGLTWQQGLAVVITSGILFLITAVTPLGTWLTRAVPVSLKHGITAGIGLLLTFIGLQKGEIIQASDVTWIALGDLGRPVAIATLTGLAVTLFLFLRDVKGGLLIGLFFTCLATWGLTGQVETSIARVDLREMAQAFASADFSLLQIPFWMAVFSMTMIVVFENMGTLSGLLPDTKKFPQAYKVTAVSTIASGVFGTSPTIAAAESASGVSAGGKTGIPALVTAVLFAASVLALPMIGLIPDNAVAPLLIVIGGMMMKSVQAIPFSDVSEGFPAFLIIACIPLTSSIADGLAFGFIAYPLAKAAVGKWRQVPALLYWIAGLFLLNLIATSMVGN